ncbi:MAG: hypothetical protein ABEJ99_00570 [Candidatus Nanohaloarchaea archaeon]
MNSEQRQLVLLISFMALLVVITLFLFVYAPEPMKPIDIGFHTPKVLGGVIKPITALVKLIIDGFNLFV